MIKRLLILTAVLAPALLVATPAAAAPSYSTPGPYTTGVWLIAQNGQAAIVDKTHVPKEGTGFSYYWLGANYNQAIRRLGDAMTKLGISFDANPPVFERSALLTAFSGGVGSLNKGPSGLLGWLTTALQAGPFFALPVPPVPAAGAAAGAGAGGTAAAGTGAAAGAGGAAAKTGVKDTVGALTGADGSAAGSPAASLSTPALAAAAAALAGTAAHGLSSSDAVDLNAGWFTSIRGRVLSVFAGLMLLALLITLAVAAVRGDSTLLLGGFAGVAEAAAITFLCLTLTAAALVATDQLSIAVAGPGLNDAQHILDGLAGTLLALAAVAKGAGILGHTGIAHLAGTGAWGLSIVSLIALGLLVIDLTLRSIAIYAVLLILPFAAAARAWPSMKVWSMRLLKVLFALVTMKLLLTLLIAMGAEMFLHGGVGGLWMGTILLLVVGLSPIALYGLLGLAEHSAFHGRHVAWNAAGAAAKARRGSGGSSQTIDNRREEIAMEPEGGSNGSSPPDGPSPARPRPKYPSGSFGADLTAARNGHDGRVRRDPFVPQEQYEPVREFDKDLSAARQRLQEMPPAAYSVYRDEGRTAATRSQPWVRTTVVRDGNGAPQTVNHTRFESENEARGTKEEKGT